MGEKLRLTAYPLVGLSHDAIRPAPLERRWMDETVDRNAYRCLPLNIANQHGWEITYDGDDFACIWDGGNMTTSIRIVPEVEKQMHRVSSHFGSAVLTFSVPYLFQTEPGWDLFVTGPLNRPKDAIAPLSGIVEADWNPATFTMNWLFTRAETVVRFVHGEPVCHVFPIPRGALEAFEPAVAELSTEPKLMTDHRAWGEARGEWLKARTPGWQKHYFKGTYNSGDKPELVERHRTKLKLGKFYGETTS